MLSHNNTNEWWLATHKENNDRHSLQTDNNHTSLRMMTTDKQTVNSGNKNCIHKLKIITTTWAKNDDNIQEIIECT